MVWFVLIFVVLLIGNVVIGCVWLKFVLDIIGIFCNVVFVLIIYVNFFVVIVVFCWKWLIISFFILFVLGWFNSDFKFWLNVFGIVIKLFLINKMVFVKLGMYLVFWSKLSVYKFLLMMIFFVFLGCIIINFLFGIKFLFFWFKYYLLLFYVVFFLSVNGFFCNKYLLNEFIM